MYTQAIITQQQGDIETLKTIVNKQIKELEKVKGSLLQFGDPKAHCLVLHAIESLDAIVEAETYLFSYHTVCQELLKTIQTQIKGE